MKFRIRENYLIGDSLTKLYVTVMKRDLSGISNLTVSFLGLAILGILIFFMNISPRVTFIKTDDAIGVVGLMNSLVASLLRVTVGALLASVTALLAALTWASITRGALQPIITIAFILAITPTPIWLTFCVLNFGLSNLTAIGTVWLSVFFLLVSVLVFQTKRISDRYWFISKQLGLSFFLRVKLVLIPELNADIISSFRIAFLVGWISIIVAETAGIDQGIGAMLQFGRQVFDWKIVTMSWALTLLGAVITDTLTTQSAKIWLDK